MKLKYILFLFVFIWFQLLYGQRNSKEKNNHILAIDLCAFYTPLFSQNFFGFNLDIKYFLSKKIATGLNWSTLNKRIDNNFYYKISQPKIYFNEIGWINQYEFLKKKRIRINMNINTGLAIAYLGDNSTQVRLAGGTGGLNGTSPTFIAKKIAANYYYLLEPGFDFAIRLWPKSDFYLTLKAKYRFVFGDSQFGTTNQFSNYYLAVGLSIISSTD